MFEAPAVASKQASRRNIIILLILGIGAALLAFLFEKTAKTAVIIPDVSLGWVVPFVLLLGCIATMPFIAKHFWEKNYHWVSMGLAMLVGVYYLAGVPKGYAALAQSMGEYISFIILLGSLFIVSGGILIRVRRRATPMVNVGLLLTGAILANVFGTTGASMLLIRPFLRINKGHIRPFHVVFFIFIVSNLGGSLTPIGDPPLFLGYLKGVPFWWVLEHCWPMWCVAIGCLLAVFFVFDLRAYKNEDRAHHDAGDLGPAVSVFGAGNVIFIAMILGGVFLESPFREGLMVLAACGSLWTTRQRIHEENVFNFGPIKEVALLFVGIFATMVPALNYLGRHAQDDAFKRFLNTPGQFYYCSGALSSVLDNAPTYVTFLEAELGKLDENLLIVAADVVHDVHKVEADKDDYLKLWNLKKDVYMAEPWKYHQDAGTLRDAIAAMNRYHHDKVASGELEMPEIKVGFLVGDEKVNWYVIGISLGSVFFGAMTYIGNGPNFMVKSIAENAGAKCPSFFGYIAAFSLPILLPILILIWGLFLSHL
jgi:Na+/H+ antiporter NhaD/arsenite permease-like protein